MRVIDLMELVRPGFSETNLSIEWITEAIKRINTEYPINKTRQKVDLQKGVRLYPLPSNLIRITRVLQFTGRQSSDGKKIYKPIAQVNNVADILEEQ